MKPQHLLIALLALTLTACVSTQPTPSANATDVQNTAVAIAGTDIALTQVALPTATLDATPTIIIPTMTLSPAQLTALATTPDPTQEALEQEIKSVIQAYFEIRYQALSIEKPDGFRLEGFGDLVSDSPEAKTFLEAELGRLAVERKQKELYRLLFVEYEFSLNFESITFDTPSQTATILVDEGFKAIMESGAGSDTQDPIVTRMGGLIHKIILRKEQGQWKIVSDEYSDDLWRFLRKNGFSPNEMWLTAQAPTEPAPTSTP